MTMANELVCRKCTRSAVIQGDLAAARELGWITEQWSDGQRFICPKCPSAGKRSTDSGYPRWAHAEDGITMAEMHRYDSSDDVLLPSCPRNELGGMEIPGTSD